MHFMKLAGMVVLMTLVIAGAAVVLPTAQAEGDDRDEPACLLPPDAGPCDGVFPRWYFNTETGICEPFTYGGCGGNANNYESLEACQHACMDICELPAVYGPCQAAHPRWHFNSVTGGCEQFIWGGCDPNANNFPTLADCEASCGGETSVCQLPLQPGECEDDPGWYYLPTWGTCAPVPQGWCGTDVNRHGTEEECLNACYAPLCFGDLNGDGTVGVADLVMLLESWASPCPSWHPCPADLTFDGTVGVSDLLTLLEFWGTCWSPW